MTNERRHENERIFTLDRRKLFIKNKRYNEIF